MRPCILNFKTYPYFWNLVKEGRKRFEFRLFDPTDSRFIELEKDWRYCSIRLINTETKQAIEYTVKGYEHFKDTEWVIIYF